jgi:hypothetical protein
MTPLGIDPETSRLVSQCLNHYATPIYIHNTVKPVVVYGSETLPVTEIDMKRLNTRDRKILRWKYGPVVQQGIRRIRTKKELRDLCKDLDIAANIKKKRM